MAQLIVMGYTPAGLCDAARDFRVGVFDLAFTTEGVAAAATAEPPVERPAGPAPVSGCSLTTFRAAVTAVAVRVGAAAATAPLLPAAAGLAPASGSAPVLLGPLATPLLAAWALSEAALAVVRVTGG